MSQTLPGSRVLSQLNHGVRFINSTPEASGKARPTSPMCEAFTERFQSDERSGSHASVLSDREMQLSNVTDSSRLSRFQGEFMAATRCGLSRQGAVVAAAYRISR